MYDDRFKQLILRLWVTDFVCYIFMTKKNKIVSCIFSCWIAVIKFPSSSNASVIFNKKKKKLYCDDRQLNTLPNYLCELLITYCSCNCVRLKYTQMLQGDEFCSLLAGPSFLRFSVPMERTHFFMFCLYHP